MRPVTLFYEPDKMFRLIFGGVFSTVGVGMLVGALLSYLHSQNLVKHGMNATGTVVGFHTSISRSSKGGTSTTYAPVVEYTAADGQTRTFTSSLSSSPPGYQEGQQVKVVYDPAMINKAEINDFMTMYFLPVLLGFMGTIFATIGGCVLFIRGRRIQVAPHPSYMFRTR